jgi:hypothetical protein
MKECNRKLIVFLIISTFIFVFACDKQPESTVPEQQAPVSEKGPEDFVEENENLIEEYGETMITAYTKGKQGGITGNLSAVQKTVEAFHATHERYPESLDEIKPMFGNPIDLSIYDYDPSTGAVSLKK